jgi:large subunit ribosomal protein L18
MHKGTRQNRHFRLRKKISGTAERPRIVATRSLNHIFAQVIDDQKGITLVSGSTYKIKSGTKTEKAKQLGEQIAKLSKDKNIETVVFDRGGSKYHGRIKEFADAMRAGGLKF